ncbi:hypothetical protein EJ06DRAFT_583924 [Trichodelitschia bisporula]|uniref:Uncharacterized protein n=1 Tax=Trichodelitschia bisporula TaxID=703511 RepID=A0A6G1HPX3_9PEZI|nr:hypothetical protein EJ06DRAFT_583924 [Trichodelitschia bisporula]
MLHNASTHSSSAPLRRSRSSSSVQRRPSASSLIDPVAAQKHALVAATVAYERAHAHTRSENAAESEAARRKTRGRRSEGEGSHFGGERPLRLNANRRLFTSALSRSNSQPLGSPNVPSPASMSISEPRCGPPMPQVQPTADLHRSSSAPFRVVRKTRSMYSSTQESKTTSVEDISFPPEPDPAVPGTRLDSIAEQERTPTHIPPPLRTASNNTPSKTYTVDEDLNRCRDQHLLDFQRRRVRNRPSLLSSFRKRSDKAEVTTLSSASNTATTYEASAPLPTDEVWSRSVPRKSSGESKASNSFRDKIRRVFRKSSASSRCLPVQQVDARRSHFGDTLTSTSSTPMGSSRGSYNTASYNTASSRSVTPVHLPPAFQPRAGSPAVSEFTVATSKSRVTSWADSTIAGTTISADDSRRLTVILEDGQLGNPAPSSRKTSVSSIFNARFFGRRRNSTADAIPSPARAVNDEERPPAQIPAQESAYASLPSQRRHSSIASSTIREISRPTIRAVTPELPVIDLPTFAPLPSHNSTPSNASTAAILADMPALPPQETLSTRRRRNRDQLGSTDPIPGPPSPTHLARRAELARERWKTPLDDSQPSFFPRCSMENVPPSPSTIKRGPGSPRGAGVISPSIYSQQTENSPVRDSPIRGRNESSTSLASRKSADTGTAVIITSRPVPVAKFPLTGKATESPARMSRDWRAWLSRETKDLSTAPKAGLALSTPMKSGHIREGAQMDDTPPAPLPPPSPASLPPPRPNITRPSSRISERRPPPASRHSSLMNDRFPMLETGRPPRLPPGRSSESLPLPRRPAADRKPSSDSAPVGVGPSRRPHVSTSCAPIEERHPGRADDVSCEALEVPALNRGRRGSVATTTRAPRLESLARPLSALGARSTSSFALERVAETRPRTPRASTPRPLLGDATLLNISRGPYAAEPITPHRNDAVTGPGSVRTGSPVRLGSVTTLPSPFPPPLNGSPMHAPSPLAIRKRAGGVKENVSPVRAGRVSPVKGGRVTPTTPTSGQKMAEQFLRKRISGGLGAGSSPLTPAFL